MRFQINYTALSKKVPGSPDRLARLINLGLVDGAAGIPPAASERFIKL